MVEWDEGLGMARMPHSGGLKQIGIFLNGLPYNESYRGEPLCLERTIRELLSSGSLQQRWGQVFVCVVHFPLHTYSL